MKGIIDLADVPDYPATITIFYDLFQRRIASIETLEQRSEILSDMEEQFRGYVRMEPQNRNTLSEIYQSLKQQCLEVSLWQRTRN